MTTRTSPSHRLRRALLCAALLCLATTAAAAQSKGGAVASPGAASPLLKRTSTRHELRRFGYGGALTVYGAPEGTITVEGWPRAEVEITADIELSAGTEDELARLAAVNSFTLDEDSNHLRVITVGTHDRRYMKQVARDFPKRLLALPWRIDYHIRVPVQTDLEIYAGRGGLTLAGVEGALRLNAGEGPSSLTLIGGDVEATIAGGPVRLHVPARSWRGRGLSLRLASGDLTVELPPNFNGDIDADVLRTGHIENALPGLAPRERTQPSERSLQVRAGGGGATLSFTVGDGTIRLKPETHADH